MTAAAFRDGLFRTGDLARRDEDGRFFFHGRRGDVMKVAGENVSAVEVEAVVGSYPAVTEVAVVAAPDPVRDQVPVAYVVAAAGEALDVEALAAYSDARLAPSKRPREYVVVERLPRTSVGKVRKHLLGRR